MAPSYTWPLAPDATPAIPSAADASAAQAAANAARGIPSFLGQGLLRPFRRDTKADFAAGGGIALVRAALGQILGTKADSTRAPGECPWDTSFGSRVHLLRHQNNTAFAAVLVQEAIVRWEPRIRVIAVVLEKTLNPRERIIRVAFNVVDRGGRVLASNLSVGVPFQLAA